MRTLRGSGGLWRAARGPALLALAAGAVAGWATGGTFALLRGVLVAAVGFAALYALGRWGRAAWMWWALPLLVPVGWLGGTLAWDGALVPVTLLFGVPIWGGGFGSRDGEVIAAAYALLVGGILLGMVPLWCALGVLTVPLALRLPRPAGDERTAAWHHWILVLNGQVLLGFLIKGMVR